jgi:hypothetical protein
MALGNALRAYAASTNLELVTEWHRGRGPFCEISSEDPLQPETIPNRLSLTDEELLPRILDARAGSTRR